MGYPLCIHMHTSYYTICYFTILYYIIFCYIILYYCFLVYYIISCFIISYYIYVGVHASIRFFHVFLLFIKHPEESMSLNRSGCQWNMFSPSPSWGPWSCLGWVWPCGHCGNGPFPICTWLSCYPLVNDHRFEHHNFLWENSL